MTTDRRSDIRSLLEANATRLPDDVSVVDIAAKCRGAALMILESGQSEEREGWGKPELAEWLAGPYRATTSYYNARPIGIAPASKRMPIGIVKIEDLLREARNEARGVWKRAAAESSDVSFGFAAVHSAWIVRCQDSTGAKGWLPVDREGMRLSERVLSLIAVDYLVRPADYLGLLSVCEECERVTFDALCRERRHCHEHRKSVARIFAAQKTSA